MKCKNCIHLYNLSNEDDVIVGKWCPKIVDSPDIAIERDCIFYKTMTYGDRIRQMTDEELADIVICNQEKCLKEYDGFVPAEICRKCMVELLRSECDA